MAVALTGIALCVVLLAAEPSGPIVAVVVVAYTAATVIGLRIPITIVRRRVERQHEVSRTLASIVGAPEAVGRALAAISELFDAPVVELTVVPDFREPRTYRFVRGVVRAEERLPEPGSPLALALHGNTTVSASVSDRTAAGEVLRRVGSYTVIAAPLVVDSVAIGAVAVYDRRGPELHRGHDRSLLAAVANDLAIAVQNVELFRSIADERAKLAEETAKLQDILDAASDGIAFVDARGRIRSWNPAMAGTTGTSSMEAVGRPWSAILRLYDLHGDPIGGETGGPLDDALAGRRSGTPLDARVRRPDGDWRWLRMTFSPVEREGRGVTGVVVVARDVTREREADDLKTDFIATVSHELRTPLTPLKGFILTLIDGDDRISAEDRNGFYVSMLRQVDRLEALVADLLIVADIDRDVVRLEREPTELLALVHDAVAIECPLDEPDRVRIVGEAVEAIGDEAAIRRIVRALVSNAVKHTDGPVTVEVTGDARAACIAVRDQGPGIARMHHERVFQRFRRLGHHLTRTTQGPGLGLAIAKGLAERLGGELTVRSDVGAGATFTLVLPRAGGPRTAGPDDRHKVEASRAENEG